MFDLGPRRLYLCVGLRDDLAALVGEALVGGVDVVQLRAKAVDDRAILWAARELVALCHDHGAPFIVNDRPDLALDCGADGVHVGQDDVPVALCRRILGDDALVGLSTHGPDDLARAATEPVNYLSAGPVVETPTKPGRPGTGIDYATLAQEATTRPVFVTGGVNERSLPSLLAAGLRRFVVVRAITEAPHPRAAARRLRDLIDEAS